MLRKIGWALLAAIATAGVVALHIEDRRIDGMKCHLLDSKTPYLPQQQMLCEDGKVYDR